MADDGECRREADAPRVNGQTDPRFRVRPGSVGRLCSHRVRRRPCRVDRHWPRGVRRARRRRDFERYTRLRRKGSRGCQQVLPPRPAGELSSRPTCAARTHDHRKRHLHRSDRRPPFAPPCSSRSPTLSPGVVPLTAHPRAQRASLPTIAGPDLRTVRRTRRERKTAAARATAAAPAPATVGTGPLAEPQAIQTSAAALAPSPLTRARAAEPSAPSAGRELVRIACDELSGIPRATGRNMESARSGLRGGFVRIRSCRGLVRQRSDVGGPNRGIPYRRSDAGRSFC